MLYRGFLLKKSVKGWKKALFLQFYRSNTKRFVFFILQIILRNKNKIKKFDFHKFDFQGMITILIFFINKLTFINHHIYCTSLKP